MTQQLIPVALFERGYKDLISVIPVNATLSPGSKITADQIGKVPGRKLSNGTWAGYGWRTHEAAIDDVRAWALDGANIGLRAGRFPGLDIDCLDEAISEELQRVALFYLGAAPVRVGKWPKRLLMYSAPTPMTRMRLWIEQKVGDESKQHLVELLGEGQQYLVYGIHPGTKQPYRWYAEPGHVEMVNGPQRAETLTPLTLAKLDTFFAAVTKTFEAQGMRVHREGDGRRKDRTPVDQALLQAPSDEELQKLIDLIPNTDALFPGREEYIRMAIAIRASAHDGEEGYTIFASWAARHEKDGRVRGNPETWRGDWRRLKGPFSVGWDFLCALGRDHGYANAPDEFPTEGSAPVAPAANPLPPQRQTVRLSEQWLAREVVARIGDRLRYVPATGRWLVWDGHVWKHDEIKLASTEVKEILHEIATEIMSRAPNPPPTATVKIGQRIESARTLGDVMRLMQADRTITTSASALDADPWILNTPSGIVDLRTGLLSPNDPAKLCTRITRTGPDFEGAMPEWRRFLAEATGNDAALEDYLQRYAGYCLTGTTREQIVMFLWGDGENGKGTFANAIRFVMGDYGNIAATGLFMTSGFEKHTTDLADLMGMRLVTASEVDGGARWNEQRLKALSGGDPVKARFMRQDNTTYQPQFKLIFFANHKPQIRDVDAALKRRIRMVPFTVKPAQIDQLLDKKIEAESPAVLAWMIEGCLKWQQINLRTAPPAVAEATTEYFEDEDAIGRWIKECCDLGGTEATETITLYESWKEWAGSVGEFVGSMKRFSQALAAKRLKRRLSSNPASRRSEFVGIQLKPLAQLLNDIPAVTT